MLPGRNNVVQAAAGVRVKKYISAATTVGVRGQINYVQKFFLVGVRVKIYIARARPVRVRGQIFKPRQYLILINLKLTSFICRRNLFHCFRILLF